MSGEFDVAREMGLAVRLPLAECVLPVAWRYEKPVPNGGSPTVFKVPGGYAAGFEIDGCYVVYLDHPRDNLGEAMELAGLVAVAESVTGHHPTTSNE